MLERTALRDRGHTHAYLMLLRIEVAAFHPAVLHHLRDASSRLDRGGEGFHTHPHCRLVSVALFLRSRCARRFNHWTVVNRYPVLWSPDLPRCTWHRDCPICFAPTL